MDNVGFGERPHSYFITCGSAEGYTPLNAFDAALIEAGIGDINLVRVSSIIPPGCKEIECRVLPPGSIVPVAYSYITSEIPGEVISAAVAVAIPTDNNAAGLIMEYSAPGHREEAEEIVRTMAIEGMKLRNREIQTVKSTSIDYKVQSIGASVAAVVLWPFK